MKLGIGLIILGTIYITDGVLQMIVVGGETYEATVMMATAAIKPVIGMVLLFFGIRRLKRDKAKGIRDAKC